VQWFLVPSHHALKGRVALQVRAGSTGSHPVVDLEDDYWCVSAEACFSACFAADLLAAEFMVGLSV
jgi:hypothetical protein